MIYGKNNLLRNTKYVQINHNKNEIEELFVNIDSQNPQRIY